MDHNKRGLRIASAATIAAFVLVASYYIENAIRESYEPLYVTRWLGATFAIIVVGGWLWPWISAIPAVAYCLETRPVFRLANVPADPRGWRECFNVYRHRNPAPPESIVRKIGHDSLFVIPLLTMLYAAAHIEDTGWWGGVIAVLILPTIWMTINRWHVHLHIDPYLPHDWRFVASAHLVNRCLALVVAYVATFTLWPMSWLGAALAVLIDFVLILWIWGPKPNCIHGEMTDEDLASFEFPIAKRMFIYHAFRLILRMMLIAIPALIIVIRNELPVKIIAAVLGLAIMLVWLVSYTNIYPAANNLWRRILLRVGPRTLQDFVRPFGVDIFGGLITTGLASIGAVRIANIPKTFQELASRAMFVSYLDFSTILESLRNIPIPVPRHNAWMYGGGFGKRDTEILRGADAVLRFCTIAMDAAKHGSEASQVRRELATRASWAAQNTPAPSNQP